MNKTPPISFIVPAYNTADTIAESVASIFNGNMHDGDELIIINDASTDTTATIIDDLKKQHPIIKILSHTVNKGSAAAARNTGIAHAHNNLIFCLDADNILVPHSVPALKEYMLEAGATAAAFGELHYFKNNNKDVTHKWIFKKTVTLADALAGTYWPGPSGNYLFTKQSWQNAGRYSETVGGAYDSWAFGLKQLLTGTTMVTMPDSYYFHRHGYDSTFVRDSSKIHPSVIGASILKHYPDILEEKDIAYITSGAAWFENLEKRPLKLKNSPIGQNGTMVLIKDKPSFLQNIVMNIKKIIPPFIKKVLKKKSDSVNKQAERVIPWFKINGDKTLRLNYPLTTSSIVVDVGGYEGQWASDIFSKYCCTIIIFEPVKKFYTDIEERFLKNKNIISYNIGLSDKNEEIKIAMLNDSSSVFKKDSALEKVTMVIASDFFTTEGITHIDLIKINIEGGEYDLLSNLIESGFISKIKDIQVQFHDFVPGAEEKMSGIQKSLSKTHRLTYQYEFVWENWTLK
jgi:FkbM family methyltransferase